MTERKISSITLEWSLKKKLSRIAHILGRTESRIVETALKDYFDNSKIIQEALQRCREENEFLESIGCTARRKTTFMGQEVYEFRPENSKVERGTSNG